MYIGQIPIPGITIIRIFGVKVTLPYEFGSGIPGEIIPPVKLAVRSFGVPANAVIFRSAASAETAKMLMKKKKRCSKHETHSA